MNNLKETREKRGMTQKQLESASGVPVITISRHETAAIEGINERILRKYCKALKCTPGRLLGIKPRKGWLE